MSQLVPHSVFVTERKEGFRNFPDVKTATIFINKLKKAAAKRDTDPSAYKELVDSLTVTSTQLLDISEPQLEDYD
jgi:hypothetical protein|tara:strand:+ start:664 stop:888 length:225 start_codon:yes stop_codon:yes gene_type:complete